MLDVSLIIPTRDRAGTLERCLAALAAQTAAPASMEVIVVDDGSGDSTPDVLAKAADGARWPLRAFRQEGRGAAAARNRGIEAARGRLLLFLDDDIIADPGLVSGHIEAHATRFAEPHDAVLGYVTWSPEVRVTPFMHWLEHGGPQFDYDSLTDGGPAERHFYTCNLSMKRSFVGDLRFDETFPYASNEDIELGHRLALKGQRVHFLRGLLGHHLQEMALSSYLDKLKRAGHTARYLHELWPELATASGGAGWQRGLRDAALNRWTAPLWRAAGRFCEPRTVAPFLYRQLCLFAYRQGYGEPPDNALS